MATREEELLALTNRSNIDPERAAALMDIARAPAAPGRTGPGEGDTGARRAFASGVKEGLLDPLTIFGVDPEGVPLDETHEKVANFLGSAVGLAIGFIPFARGVGAVMKGAGLTARMSKPVADFVRFSTAGTIQAAGTAENLDEVPEMAALGLVLGASVDGLFLARALRGRKDLIEQTVNFAAPTAPTTGRVTSQLPDEAVTFAARPPRMNPSPDDPRALLGVGESGSFHIPADVLAKELTLLPRAHESPITVSSKVGALTDDNMSYEQAIATLGDVVDETVMIPGLADPTDVLQLARVRMPGAQIESRQVIKGKVHEVLIHNPIDEGSRLSPAQIKQWKETGFFSDQQVVYDGRTFYVGKERAADGRVQIRNREGTVVFAPRVTEVSVPLTPRVFNKNKAKINRMRNAATGRSDQMGFAYQTPSGGLMRGVADTSEYLEAESFESWIRSIQHELVRIQAASPDEAIQQYISARGIKGLVEIEEGITTNVRVFDQSTVQQFEQTVPTVGVVFDDVTVAPIESTGETAMISFRPSWKNGVIGNLRAQGFVEKEIKGFVDQLRMSEALRLQSAMDDEFQAVAQASRFQFFEGCI